MCLMLEINKVHLWDCLEIMKQLPDKCIDLVLTDPPYWIDASKWASGFGSAGHKTKKYEDDWDKFIPSQEYFDELLRVGKTIIIFGGNYFTDMLPMSKHWIVWNKIGGHDFQNPFSDAELAWTSIPKKPIKMYTVIQQWFVSDEKDRYHPTQKPVNLFRMIVNDYTDKDMIILDCFAWSWTTWVACKELWRNYILIEKEAKYIDIINKRLENITPSLF